MPYRCARRFLSEFFPLGDDPPSYETIRRRTIRVGAGLERESLSRAKTQRAVPPSETVTVSIGRRTCPDGTWPPGQDVRGDGGPGQQ